MVQTIHPSVEFWHRELSNISPQAVIGEGSIIHAGVHIHDTVVIGKNCKIEAGAFLPNGVTLEDNVFVGPHVCFTNDAKLTEPFEISPTLVRNRAKIGANSTIRAGVTIGENAIIGCGSVVLEDVKDNEVWAGNPARLLRYGNG